MNQSLGFLIKRKSGKTRHLKSVQLRDSTDWGNLPWVSLVLNGNFLPFCVSRSRGNTGVAVFMGSQAERKPSNGRQGLCAASVTPRASHSKISVEFIVSTVCTVISSLNMRVHEDCAIL